MRPSDTSRERVFPLSTDLELRRRFMVVKEPIPGNLRFGVLLEVLDEVAGGAALEYVRSSFPSGHVVTAALDEVVVRNVADVTSDVRCRARINHVGRTSMEVGVRVESSPDGEHLASCYFTMAARGREGGVERGLVLPRLDLADEAERRREARAASRRAASLAEAEKAMEPPTREEFLLIAELYREQEQPGFSGPLVRDLVAETWERTFPDQDNPWDTIFGGYIMRRAYELSVTCAERVAPLRPIAAAVNRINFFRPVHIGDKLHLTSRVVYTAGPIVCVETSIERQSRDRAVRALSNSCLFTFVNVDAQLVPQDVPPVYPSSHAEERRYLAARRNVASLAARTGKGWLGSGGITAARSS
jgi:acyl-CoA hydrolase